MRRFQRKRSYNKLMRQLDKQGKGTHLFEECLVSGKGTHLFEECPQAMGEEARTNEFRT
jgi:hypothetical protein